MKPNKYKHQITKNKNFFQSLYHALGGLKDLIVQERNFRIHIILSMLYAILGFVFKVSVNDWLWIILGICLVFVTEAINTVVENMSDLIVGHHYNAIVKRIKDIAAGGVLITSVFALFVVVTTCLSTAIL